MSYATLKSENVFNACQSLINDIDADRKDRIERYIEKKMKEVKPKPITRWFSFNRKKKYPDVYYTREEAEASLDEVYEGVFFSQRFMIMSLYSDSYNTAKRLRNLAMVSSEINVSPEDFQIIKSYYQNV